MPKRGQPTRADGLRVTPKGYLAGQINGRFTLGHVAVWEAANGPKPDGYQIHHVNGDKQDNRLDNLILVDSVTHKRIHSGCELRDGEWWKPCGVCGEFKRVGTADWYFSREGWPRWNCRPCHIAFTVESRRQRKARRAAVA